MSSATADLQSVVAELEEHFRYLHLVNIVCAIFVMSIVIK